MLSQSLYWADLRLKDVLKSLCFHFQTLKIDLNFILSYLSVLSHESGDV